MKLHQAKVIIQEVTAWVNHLRGGAPQPEKKFEYSLWEVAQAREKVLMNNILMGNSRRDDKIIAVPNEQLCAGLFITASLQGMEENSKLLIARVDGRELVLYGPEKKEILISPNQLTIEEAISEATKGNGPFVIIH
jgi:hypothetical protein